MKEWKDWVIVYLMILNTILLIFCAWVMLSFAGAKFQGEVLTYEKLMGPVKEVQMNTRAK